MLSYIPHQLGGMFSGAPCLVFSVFSTRYSLASFHFSSCRISRNVFWLLRTIGAQKKRKVEREEASFARDQRVTQFYSRQWQPRFEAHKGQDCIFNLVRLTPREGNWFQIRQPKRDIGFTCVRLALKCVFSRKHAVQSFSSEPFFMLHHWNPNTQKTL